MVRFRYSPSRDAKMLPRSFAVAVALSLSPFAAPLRAASDDPTVEQALRLSPVQKDVEFDKPARDAIEKCSIKSEKVDAAPAWVVYGPAGELMRRFVDTNSDGAVDQWCYFKDGLEVYRDIDSNFNRKADRYQWLHTAGTRLGVDTDEDRTIDSWQNISAEEVTQEVVAALRDGDARRFARLLISPQEVARLGLGTTKQKELAARLRAASDAIAKLRDGQSTLAADARWAHFGGSRPGLVPKGTDGSVKDVTVYENVVTTVEAGGKHEQVFVGTLIQIGSTWRTIDAPRILTPGETELAQSGFFFRAATPRPLETADPTPKVDESVRKILAELEKIDKDLAAADPKEQSPLHTRKAELLQQMAEEAKEPAERAQWLHQLADSASLAIQSGHFPEGLKLLEDLQAALARNPDDAELVSYFAYRRLTGEYGASLLSENADFPKIQKTWTEDLEKYLKDYPKSADAAEAMMQLAIALEFGGKDDEAKTWYAKIVDQFPTSTASKKAAGARLRLNSVGKKISLAGNGLDGRPVDLAGYAGRTVLIHYWATWCEPCKNDMKQIKELHAKYAPQGFAVIGVNFDNEPQTAAEFLREQPLGWAHLYERGGLESRLANELGILTLPTMILVDGQGKVINRNIHVSEIESALKAQIKTAAKPKR
jgi:thiol-disulfide isomerase/thioredoxin